MVVVLERLQLDAGCIGDVFQLDGGEIGEAGFGADAGELGAGVGDHIVAVRRGVGKGLQDRLAVVRLTHADKGTENPLASRGLPQQRPHESG